MDKNRFLTLRPATAASITLFLLWSVLATMLSTRAGLSISMVLLGAFAMATRGWKDWRKTGWAWLGAVWLGGYALSYFWSEDKTQWATATSVKVPVVLLPIAFALLPVCAPKQLRILVAGFVLVLLAGIAYSLAHYFADPAAVIEGYQVSHVLRTPLFNSHIAFSALVACGVAIGACAMPLFKRGEKAVIGIALGLFVLYLHVLASKTGLLMIYLLGLLMLFRLALRGKPQRALQWAVVATGLTYAAFSFIPTLHKRVDYVNYTIVQVLEGRRDGLYSDLGRALSWEVAARVIAQHPVAGVGAGDMLPAMRAEYAETYPAVAAESQLIPHNQPLCVALAAGVTTLLIFMAWIIAPVRWMRRHPRRFYLRAVWAMLLVPLLVEPFLEVQGGVAVYLYALLFCQYLLRCTATGMASEGGAPTVSE